jgi:hypothetical protein
MPLIAPVPPARWSGGAETEGGSGGGGGGAAAAEAPAGQGL